MPPVPLQSRLHRRSEASAKTFSIVFAVIALLVVLACLVWGFVLPRLRKKSVIGSLRRGGGTNSSNRNDGHHLSSHPAVLRGFRSKKGPVLDRYNPRTESPFPPNGPEPRTAPPAPFATSDTLSNPRYRPGSSHGLFSPTKSCNQPRQGIMISQNETLGSQGKAKSMKNVEIAVYEHDQDYILPVPEPLVLKPRPAGRPLPLTRQLERFPIPIGTLRRKNNLSHPIKLFEGMESRDSHSTVDTVGTPCPTQHQVRRMNLSREHRVGTSHRNHDDNMNYVERGRAANEAILDDLSERTVRLRSRIQEKKATVAGSKEKKIMQRAGTVTRPRTPVAEMRERFNQNSKVPTNGTTSMKDECTPSVNPFDTPVASSTPPTSPRYSDKIRDQSRMQFPGRQVYPVNQATNSQQQDSAHIPGSAPGSQTAVLNPLLKLSNISGSATNRLKPARLNLTLFSNFRSRERHAKGHSLSSFSTLFRPMMVPRSYQSHRASSIYSRDTKGMSLLRSPTHDEFLQYQAVQPSSFIDERNAMLMNNVRSKIDEWDLHTADLDVSVLSSTRLKRTLSDCGPRGSNPRDYLGPGSVRPLWVVRPTYENADHPGPRTQIEHNSPDIFNKKLNRFGSGCRDHATHSTIAGNEKPVTDGGPGEGTGNAPGGVAWI